MTSFKTLAITNKLMLDTTQIALMNEECILVDMDDKVIGSASKKICHLMENINNAMLHRAFSVFLFNKENKLLLQQRSKHKITFPLFWTNTCCSHPLDVDLEKEEYDNLGVKRAAMRKLLHELGISTDSYKLEDLKFLTRIVYKAPSDGLWGEHEIDYILFLKGDFDLNVNENEVCNVKYLSELELKEFFGTCGAYLGRKDVLFTPWFKLIVHNFLFKWWNQEIVSEKTIHKLLD